MSNVSREKWKQFLFEEGKEYTLEEAIEHFVRTVMVLKDRGVRVTEQAFLDMQQFDKAFRLVEEERERYIKKFCVEGYASEDSAKIVTVMDVMYHTFDISVDKAYELAKYAANNRLTLTQTVKDKLNVDFEEIREFINTVLPENLEYFRNRTLEYGKELNEMIDEVFTSLSNKNEM